MWIVAATSVKMVGCSGCSSFSFGIISDKEILPIHIMMFICFKNFLADSAKKFLKGQFLRRLDPDLRIPESYQFNLGFEHELGRALVFEASYTWNRG